MDNENKHDRLKNFKCLFAGLFFTSLKSIESPLDQRKKSKRGDVFSNKGKFFIEKSSFVDIDLNTKENSEIYKHLHSSFELSHEEKTFLKSLDVTQLKEPSLLAEGAEATGCFLDSEMDLLPPVLSNAIKNLSRSKRPLASFSDNGNTLRLQVKLKNVVKKLEPEKFSILDEPNEIGTNHSLSAGLQKTPIYKNALAFFTSDTIQHYLPLVWLNYKLIFSIFENSNASSMLVNYKKERFLKHQIKTLDKANKILVGRRENQILALRGGMSFEEAILFLVIFYHILRIYEETREQNIFIQEILWFLLLIHSESISFWSLKQNANIKEFIYQQKEKGKTALIEKKLKIVERLSRGTKLSQKSQQKFWKKIQNFTIHFNFKACY